MKKIISVFLCLIFTVLLCACEPTSTPVQNPTEAPNIEYTLPPEVTFTPAESNIINGIKIEFLGAEFTQDSDFNDALRIYVQATNISDATVSVHYNVAFQASQGETPLNVAAPLSVTRYDGMADSVIRPSTTIRCTEVVTLNNLEESVTVSYHDLFDIDSTLYVTETFDLKNLPEKPDPFFHELVEDPKFTEGLQSFGAIGEFNVAILDYETIQLMEGNSGLRVYVEVKNNSQNSIIFSNELSLTVFQDNIALQTDYPLNDVEADGLYDVEIPAGESLILASVFELISESPIEIEIGSYWVDEKVGGVYKVAE